MVVFRGVGASQWVGFVLAMFWCRWQGSSICAWWTVGSYMCDGYYAFALVFFK